MNVLIVGAGPLGRVFGQRLALGGASVSVLVRAPQTSAARAGFDLRQLRRWPHASGESLFTPSAVFADPSEIGGPWQSVWLCVQSSALSESWLQQLAPRLGPATVVTIGQGLFDRVTLERIWPGEQIVEVVPSLFSFEETLEPDVVNGKPHTAYWLVPGMPLAVSGRPARARSVTDALRGGGLKARYAGAIGTGSLVATLNIPYFAALETAGWSFDRLDEQMPRAAAAAREAAMAAARTLAVRQPAALATSPHLMRVMLSVLRRLAPFDFEQYARRHFNKVGAQTREMLDGWIASARSHGLASSNLEQLRADMPPLALR